MVIASKTPMSSSVRSSVGRLVGLSVIISSKDGKFHFHATIGLLFGFMIISASLTLLSRIIYLYEVLLCVFLLCFM